MKCCDLNSGKLRHRIQIMRETLVEDNTGGQVSEWNEKFNPFCWIKPASGNERFQAGKLEANITHKIYMRYFDGILPQDKIVYGSREMQIRAILNIEEKGVWLELSAVEGQVN